MRGRVRTCASISAPLIRDAGDNVKVVRVFPNGTVKEFFFPSTHTIDLIISDYLKRNSDLKILNRRALCLHDLPYSFSPRMSSSPLFVPRRAGHPCALVARRTDR